MGRVVYVHIGLSKTGSTSIQKLLINNKAALLKQGILYPDLFGELSGQKSIVAYAASATGLDFSPFVKSSYGIKNEETARLFRKKFSRRFQEIAEKNANISTTVLSCELLSKDLKEPEQLKAIKEILDKYFDEVKILVYLRSQESRFKSMYSQALKMGNTPNFSTFIRRKADYFMLLELWINVFGLENIDARILERDFLIGEDLVTDFYSRIGGNHIEVLSLPPRVNESISAEVAYFLEKFNSHVPAFKQTGELSEARKHLIPFLEKYSIGKPKVSLSHPEVMAIRNKHAVSNEKIRELLFPGRKELFTVSEATVGTNSKPTTDEIIALSAYLWNQEKLIFKRESNQRKQRIATLEADKIRQTSKKKTLDEDKFYS